MGSGQSMTSLFHNNTPCTIVSIEGNIGSGKTTGKEKLKQYIMKKKGLLESSSSTIFVDEPTDEWQTIQDDKGVPILVNLYSDLKRFAFRFQMMAYISRLKKLRDAARNPNVKIIITERCLITDAHVFARMLYDSKHIEEDEYQIYTRWFDEFAKEVEPSCIVYFQASTDVCMTRIKKRNRPGEQEMQHDYLDKCNMYHHEWLIKDSKNLIPILVLNANEENCDYSENIYKYMYDVRASRILGVLHRLKVYINGSGASRDTYNGEIHNSSSCVNV
jgi:deoxyadenosine/deoxycytidine kinase